MDSPYNDITRTPSTKLEDCINLCDRTTGCVGIAMRNGACYTKARVNPLKPNIRVAFAQLLNPSSTTTSATATATTTTTTTSTTTVITTASTTTVITTASTTTTTTTADPIPSPTPCEGGENFQIVMSFDDGTPDMHLLASYTYAREYELTAALLNQYGETFHIDDVNHLISNQREGQLAISYDPGLGDGSNNFQVITTESYNEMPGDLELVVSIPDKTTCQLVFSDGLHTVLGLTALESLDGYIVDYVFIAPPLTPSSSNFKAATMVRAVNSCGSC